MTARIIGALVYAAIVAPIFVTTPAPQAARQETLPAYPAPTPQLGRPVKATEPVDPNLVRLEAELAASRIAETEWQARMAVSLNAEPGPALEDLQRQIAAVMRLRSARLSAVDSGWPQDQVDALFGFLLIDARRFWADADFRAAVIPILRDGLAAEVPTRARENMLSRLNAIEFGAAERVEVAWGLARRSSRSREVLFGEWPARLGSVAPIQASIYSLPSAVFDYDEASAFLRGIHALAPHRDIVVLSNAPLVDRLRRLEDDMPLYLIDTLGRHYSPWPRDPFGVIRPPDGPVTIVTRPNTQAQRRFDANMARELIQGLPEELDAKWGGVRWTTAPLPFHGGHTLSTPGTIWASVHTLLPRIEEILGEHPTPQGLAHVWARGRFLAATQAAQSQFEAVFGEQVRFVHPLPSPEGLVPIAEIETMLVGGGTSDLDSLVAIVPLPGGQVVALVADFSLGSQVLANAREAELDRFAEIYRLDVTGEDLRAALVDQLPKDHLRLIGSFLDTTTGHLRDQDIEVFRVPLLHVPVEVMREYTDRPLGGFLVTWTNVVFETIDGRVYAEGFGSGLAGADEMVRATFARAGAELRYTPTLGRSVMRDGGYRCASNHVRLAMLDS